MIENQPEEISFYYLYTKAHRLFKFLLSKWVVIFIGGAIGGGFGLAYAFWKKPIYTAVSTFVLEDDSKSGMSQYAGLASMVGIDLGGASSGLFSGDNILALYKSRSMIAKTLLSSYTFDNKTQLLIDRYIEYNNLRKAWDSKPELKEIDFHSSEDKFTRRHDSLISIFSKNILKGNLNVIKADKKLNIIRVEFISEDELFAKAFAEILIHNVNNFYINTKTKKSLQNVRLLEFQADSVRKLLNNSIGQTASALDKNPNANPVLQVLKVPSQRRTIDVQANSAIYAEVVKNLELARISLRKETPLIQIIDSPILPLDKEKVSKLIGLIVGGILGGLTIITILILKRAITKLNQR